MKLLAVLAIGVALIPARSEEMTTVPVCEVLRNLRKFDQRMIAVRGEWYADRENSYLRGR